MRRGGTYLRKGLILLIGLPLWLACASGCAGPSGALTTSPDATAEPPTTAPHVLKEIRVVDLDVHLHFKLGSSGSIIYTAFKAIDPLRLVVDLPDTVSEALSFPLAVENEMIGKIETMMLTHDSRPLTRVEIGLNQDTSFIIDQVQDDIRVIFFKAPGLAKVEPAPADRVSELQVESQATEISEALAAPASQPHTEEPAVSSPPLAPVTLPPATKILGIESVIVDQELRVSILADGSLAQHTAFHLTDPPRVVVDLLGVQSAETEDAVKLSGPLVRRIRVGCHRDKVRVVFDLIPTTGLPYHLIREDDRLEVSFKPGSGFPPR